MSGNDIKNFASRIKNGDSPYDDLENALADFSQAQIEDLINDLDKTKGDMTIHNAVLKFQKIVDEDSNGISLNNIEDYDNLLKHNTYGNNGKADIFRQSAIKSVFDKRSSLDSAATDDWDATLASIKNKGGTIILDWDNTVDYDREDNIAEGAKRWLNELAEHDIDVHFVSGRANNQKAREQMKNALKGAVETKNAAFWKEVINERTYFAEAGKKESIYLRIIGNKSKKKFFLMDDDPKNIASWNNIMPGTADAKEFYYQPLKDKNGDGRTYARSNEVLDELRIFEAQMP